MRWKILLIGIVLISGIGLALGFWWPFHSRGDVLRLPGVVEMQEIRLCSKIGGRVAEIRTPEDAGGQLEGQIVESGQVLVVFEAPELEAQRDQWQARLESAQADLEKTQNGARKEERDSARAAVKAALARWLRLKKGPRIEEINQAKAEVEAAKADSKLAKEEFTRIDTLFQRNVLAQSDIDAARAALNRTAFRTALSQAKLDMLLAGNRYEDIDEAAADLKKWEANYQLLLAGSRSEDIAAAQARVAEAYGKLKEIEASLEERYVRAPERALVEVLAVRKGDVVLPNAPVVRILRAEDLWVRVYVPEPDVGKLRQGQRVKVLVDAYRGQEIEGQVIQIAGISEFTPRNVQSADERKHQVFGVKVRVDDPQGIFKSGMAAEVVIQLHGPKE